MKEQFYDISADFLVPAYNMPADVHSAYIATQNGNHLRGSISINVWLVRATQSNPKQSMLESLRTEEQNYKAELEKVSTEETSADKETKVYKLKHGLSIFSYLVKMAQSSVYQKKPDAEFLRIADANIRYSSLNQYKPDLKNYLYLAGLSRYEER